MNNYYGGQWAEGSRPSDVLPLGVVNAFVQRVYLVMAAGLAISGLTGLFLFNLLFSASPLSGIEGGAEVAKGLYLTQAGVALITNPLIWVVILLPLAVPLIFRFGFHRLSYLVATILYIVYCVSFGFSLAILAAQYTAASMAMTFFITAGTFAAMSIYGMTTKTDLTKLGSYLKMAVIGIIIAILVNLFLQSSTFEIIIAIIGVIVFTGLAGYYTQQVMRDSLTMNTDTEEAKKAALLGAFLLYVTFINLFLMLLRLLGDRR